MAAGSAPRQDDEGDAGQRRAPEDAQPGDMADPDCQQPAGRRRECRQPRLGAGDHRAARQDRPPSGGRSFPRSGRHGWGIGVDAVAGRRVVTRWSSPAGARGPALADLWQRPGRRRSPASTMTAGSITSSAEASSASVERSPSGAATAPARAIPCSAATAAADGGAMSDHPAADAGRPPVRALPRSLPPGDRAQTTTTWSRRRRRPSPSNRQTRGGRRHRRGSNRLAHPCHRHPIASVRKRSSARTSSAIPRPPLPAGGGDPHPAVVDEERCRSAGRARAGRPSPARDRARPPSASRRRRADAAATASAAAIPTRSRTAC